MTMRKIIFFLGFAGLINAHMVLNAIKIGTKNEEEDLLVQKISTGYIRGRKIVTDANVEGFMFLSVPIAEPPVGDLRFRAPVPRRPWDGVLDTTNYTVSCYWDSTHTSYNAKDFEMDEDCIQVHVFTNRKCLTKGNCVVAMYVHGGVFEFGSPTQYRQDFIVDNFGNATRDVVFVTVSYRQALFGVANFNWKLDLSMDMNAGFHDLVHALRWIKAEIKAFGGNPDKLTVMGHSGGAGLTKSLAMSPMSKPLINQIIVMSMSGDISFVKDKNEGASRAAARAVGCADFPPEDKKWDNKEIVEKVLKCLRSKSGKELALSQPAIEVLNYQFRFAAQDSGDNAVLPGTYAQLFRETEPIPTLTGTVAKEFLDSRAIIHRSPNGSFVTDKEELHRWAIKALAKAEWLTPHPHTVKLVEREYDSYPKAAYLYDDVEIYTLTYELATHQALKGADAFVYEYIYPNVSKAYDRGPYMKAYDSIESPHHAQELAYLLGQHAGVFTPKDHQIKYLYSQIFADFINHGTPASSTRKWHKFDADRANYFVIDFPDPDLTSPGETEGYHKRAVEFWDLIVPRIEGPKTVIVSEKQLDYDPIPLKNNNNTVLLIEPIVNGSSVPLAPKAEALQTTPSPIEETTRRRRKQRNDHQGLNWAIMFWIGVGIIILLAISHIFTCIKLKSKKDEYQHI